MIEDGIWIVSKICHKTFGKQVTKMVSFQQAIQTLRKEELAPIYLLLGTEYYFVEQFKKQLYHKIGEDSENINEFDLKETAIQQVIADLETLPFFSDRNISIAEHPIFLLGTHEKIHVTHDLASFEKYIENPAPYSTLILIAPYEKIDKRKKITKLLLKHSLVIDCNPIKGQSLRKWVQDILKANNIQMTEAALLRFEAEFGPNLYLLQSEIEKMVHFIGEGGTIDEEQLVEIMSSSVDQTAIVLADSVLQNNLPRAISIYQQLIKLNEDPIGMIALLSYQFRMILQVKLLTDKGYPLQKIQSMIKAHPYVIKKASERMRRYDKQTLYSIIDELAETDYIIKRGKMKKEIAFEMLLYRLMKHLAKISS